MAAQYSFEIGLLEGIVRRYPDYIEALEALAQRYTQAGRIAEGLALDRHLVTLKPKCPTAFYNLACSLSLSGDKKGALGALTLAVSLGYSDFQWMRKDSDLKPLHGTPEFQSLMS